MNKNHAQTFWVVRFEALDHEFYGAVILGLSMEPLSGDNGKPNHVRHRKASHVEYNRLPVVSGRVQMISAVTYSSINMSR